MNIGTKLTNIDSLLNLCLRKYELLSGDSKSMLGGRDWRVRAEATEVHLPRIRRICEFDVDMIPLRFLMRTMWTTWSAGGFDLTMLSPSQPLCPSTEDSENIKPFPYQLNRTKGLILFRLLLLQSL